MNFQDTILLLSQVNVAASKPIIPYKNACLHALEGKVQIG